MQPKYPQWICSDCGSKLGRKKPGVATWHIDECGICKKQTTVTEPRDFGHLIPNWSAQLGAVEEPKTDNDKLQRPVGRVTIRR